MVERVHKKLQRRQRTSDESKEYSPDCLVGNNRRINRLLPKPSPTPSPGSADAIGHDNSRSLSNSHIKADYTQEKQIRTAEIENFKQS
jgi:hypothetical protein